MTDETQDEPALAQNSPSEDERVAGLLAQLRADLSGEDAATVDAAVRRRLADTGIVVDDEVVRGWVADISG